MGKKNRLRRSLTIMISHHYNALKTIKKEFKHVTWYIKGEIISPQKQPNSRFNRILIDSYLKRFDHHMKRIVVRDKCIKYVRYRTEFVIGIQGPKKKAKKLFADCQQIIKKMYLLPQLNLSLAHIEKSFLFLKHKIKLHSKTNRGIGLEIPSYELIKYAAVKRYGNLRTFKSTHRPSLLHYSELDIMRIYNRELLSVAKYYRLVNNFSNLGRLFYLAESSFLKTIANKKRSTVKRTGKRLRKHNQGLLTVKDNQVAGRTEFLSFIRLKDVRYLNLK